MTAAIYARVSTKDKGQTNDNQLRELRAFAERLGYPIYQEYCDQESGSKSKLPDLYFWLAYLPGKPTPESLPPTQRGA